MQEKGWTVVRIVLGLAQVFGATTSIALLLSTGLSQMALVAVAGTCLCTTGSVLLFGARPADRR